ncbi:hypothetical protein D3C86_1643190 [compost metagenome]
MATCTFGTVVHMRPLPSFSTRHRLPVSATAKLTPDSPMPARRNSSRRARRPVWISSFTSVVGVKSARLPAKVSLTSCLFLWMAGMMMWDGVSPSSWTMNSPMSLSRQRMPWRAISWLKPTSSLTMDLPLTMLLTPCCWAMPRMMALASAGVWAQCTRMPLRSQLASSCANSSGSRERQRWRMCSAASRTASSSTGSAKASRRLPRR